MFLFMDCVIEQIKNIGVSILLKLQIIGVLGRGREEGPSLAWPRLLLPWCIFHGFSVWWHSLPMQRLVSGCVFTDVPLKQVTPIVPLVCSLLRQLNLLLGLLLSIWSELQVNLGASNFDVLFASIALGSVVHSHVVFAHDMSVDEQGFCLLSSIVHSRASHSNKRNFSSTCRLVRHHSVQDRHLWTLQR
jgi:hypothetical protein